MNMQSPSVPQAITSPPAVPKHIHRYGPCERLPFGNTSARFCTAYPGCRANIPC
jgi:hypothetical protein